MKKLYITTPLYYVNASPHIGHSYTNIAVDAISRFYRLKGYEVFFMTGTDEHGEKIEKAALEKGYSGGEEKKFVDEIVPSFKELWSKLNVSYDYFIRTTDSNHEKTVQKVLEILYENREIYQKDYKGWFCVPCENFWSDTQSQNGSCPDCKRTLEKVEEMNYFFRLSKYQSWLIDYIKTHPDFIKPDIRKNEVLGFLKEELQDLCISRPKSRTRWGIEIPFARDYVTYVWFDALINYISGPGYVDDRKAFDRLWPADYHLIGKDILRHHAVYWPIMLHAIGEEPPRTIFAHGWWIQKGEKMSKSKGNIVDPLVWIAEYGVDAFRYFLLREVPFGLDGTFSEEAFIARYNGDLANDLGNLLNRSLTMVEKYFDGVVPVVSSRPTVASMEEGLISKATTLGSEVDKHMTNLDFSATLENIWGVVNSANKYIEDKAPWKLAKEDKKEELSVFIFVLLQIIATIAIFIYPYMPDTALSIWRQLGLKRSLEEHKLEDTKGWNWTEFGGITVKKEGPLFPRIDVG